METFDRQYWDERYLKGETGWDIGAPSTPLKQYIDQLKDKDISILIPGCGNAYEAAYLCEQGFTNITLIDLSEVVTTDISRRFPGFINEKLNVITGDFFEHTGSYDLVLEQTFFCALHPSQREQYVMKTKELLKPGGTLAGVLFNRNFEGGPPFGGSKEEYHTLFSRHFQKLKLEPCYNSIKPRQGTELFIVAKA